MKTLKSVLPKAAVFFVIFSILCGIVYTLVVTGLAQVFFHDQANGSIIEVDGKKYGSELMAQQFNDEDHMWGRIMNVDVSTYTDEDGNRLMYAAPSNLSPAGENLRHSCRAGRNARASNPDAEEDSIPVDLVTCSGSGLDPHISPAAAEYQVARLADASGRSKMKFGLSSTNVRTGDSSASWGKRPSMC